MNKTVTIRIRKVTAKSLRQLKDHHRDTYDDVIWKLFGICDDVRYKNDR